MVNAGEQTDLSDLVGLDFSGYRGTNIPAFRTRHMVNAGETYLSDLVGPDFSAYRGTNIPAFQARHMVNDYLRLVLQLCLGIGSLVRFACLAKFLFLPAS